MNKLVAIIFCFVFAIQNLCYAGTTLTNTLPPQFDSFYDDFIKYMDTKIDSIIKEKQKIIEDKTNNIPEYKKQLAREDIKTLKLLKKRINDVETVRKLYENTKTAFDNVSELSKKWENLHYTLPPTSFFPEEIVIKDIGNMSSYLDTLTKGYDYYKKIVDLGSKLKVIDSTGYDKNTSELARSLLTLGTIMSEFGEQIPLIGSFLKGYGDITSQFVDVINGLKQKIDKNINQGCIGTGSALIGDIRNKAMLDQGYHVLVCREPGFRDLYVNIEDPSDVYLWDKDAYRLVDGKKKKGRWYHLIEVAPGVSKQDMIKAYKIYYKKGVKNISVRNILYEIKRVVDLKPELKSIGVAPGEKLQLKVRVIRSLDGKEATNAYVDIYSKDNTLVAQGKSGEWMFVNVPKAPGKYFLYAKLGPNTKKIWISLKDAKINFFVGTPTTVHLSVSKTKLNSKSPEGIDLLVSVKDLQDHFVERGILDVSTIPSMIGYFKPKNIFIDQELSNGNIHIQWIPYGDIPKGKIKFIARYKGVNYGDNYLCPSHFERTVLCFEYVDTKTEINRTVLKNNLWELHPLVLDNKGNVLTNGTIEFFCRDGDLRIEEQNNSGAKVFNIKLGNPIYWKYPDNLNSTTLIRAKFKGYWDKKKFIYYIPSERFLLLPEIEKLKTNIKINDIKRLSKDKWSVSIKVLDEQGNFVKSGCIKIHSSLGNIDIGGSIQGSVCNLERPFSFIWTKSEDNLDMKSEIILKYSGGIDKYLEYLPAEKKIFLPKQSLLDTEIISGVKKAAKGLFKYELQIGVKDSKGKLVEKGKLFISVDKGSFFPGKKDVTFDLSYKNPIILLWQGKEHEGNIVVSIKYSGDGSGKEGENLIYKGCNKIFTIQNQDTIKTSIFLLTTDELNNITGLRFKKVKTPRVPTHLDKVQKSEDITEVESNRFWNTRWKSGGENSILFRDALYLSVIFSSDIERSWSLLVPQLYSRYSSRGIKLYKLKIGDDCLYYKQNDNEFYFVRYKDFMIFVSRFNGTDGKKIIQGVIKKIDNRYKPKLKGQN
ncbi:hypothetical protein [Desulfothermus sp.]